MKQTAVLKGWPGDDEGTALPCGDNRYTFVGGPDRHHLEVHCAKCPARWSYLSPKLAEVRWLMVAYPPRRRADAYGFMRLGPAPRAVPGQTEAFDTASPTRDTKTGVKASKAKPLSTSRKGGR